MIQPTVYGQAIIILVYVPLLTFSGVEGKMFEPMALTVIIALAAAFVLSITLVPALIAIAVTGRVRESENAAVRGLKQLYAPLLARAVASPFPVIAAAVLLFGGALILFNRLGQEFIPALDEKNIAMHALRIPSTALIQSQAMQLAVEKTISRLPQVAFVFSKTGTAEIGVDPMPPSASDTFIILKPREAWPDPRLRKEALVAEIERVVKALPGNAYEFTQPIQMRFNELLAGVRGDIAVKVFGDEFDPLLQAANQIAGILRGVAGASDVRVEQVAGLPVLEIAPDKAEIARRGLSLSAVQEVIGTAIGGREAGAVYEGDRHFDIVVRLGEAGRNDIDALKSLPVPLPPNAAGQMAGSIPLSQVARFRQTEGRNQISRENGKRRVVVTANVRGRDIASVVADARARIEERVRLPAGLLADVGRTVREPRRRTAAPDDRGAGVLRADIPAARWRTRFRPRCSVGVQRRAARAHGRGGRAVAARHAVFGLGGGRIHRPLRHSGSQRPGDADLHHAADAAGAEQTRGHPRRRAHALAPSGHDRLGGFAGIRADGDRHRHRR